MIEVLLWLSIGIVLYVYFGYPLLVMGLSKLRHAPSVQKAEITPTVSLLIPAYNEEKVIAQKLENSLHLDYPQDKLEIIVVSDGSTDETEEIVHAYAGYGIQLLELPKNVGKASAQNQAVEKAAGDILLFTDAEAYLQPCAARNLIRHFQDENVGCVVGKVVYLNEEETGVSKGEGFYWQYELLLRQKESELGILAMGSGSIMAVKRGVFESLDPAVSDDFVLPMRSAIQGYKTIYDPQAVAELRLFQVNPQDMFKTKVRTITLDMRSVFLCRAILNPFRYPLFAWGLISHKLLRWLMPYFLIILFWLSLLLVGHPFYNLVLALQVISYLLASVGYFWQRKAKPPLILGIPFSFCLVNLAALAGVAKFITGKKSGRWEPVRAVGSMK